MIYIQNIENSFNTNSQNLFTQLKDFEKANLNLEAESTAFVRVNGNKVRQNTDVEQATVSLNLQRSGRSYATSFTITGQVSLDAERFGMALQQARHACDQLPEDPFLVEVKNNGQSEQRFTGGLLPAEQLISTLLEPSVGLDIAGIYCGGLKLIANQNSAGQKHLFLTESFYYDYSLYNGAKAAKGMYAGTHFDKNAFKIKINETARDLKMMDQPKKKLAPGAYRAYLAPAAVAELYSPFNWTGTLSYAAYKQGICPLNKLADKERSFSPLYSLNENFSTGLTPRFNSLGELAPESMPLIEKGQLKNFFISSRSAKEYGAKANMADNNEGFRALEMQPGSLKREDILKELGTGLYLSNLHYVNYSDRQEARLTGMTRYACFWVENGQIVAPIEDLRFDESLYSCFGDNLLAVTEFSEINPSTMTYESRSIGGDKVCGVLVKDFKFTL